MIKLVKKIKRNKKYNKLMKLSYNRYMNNKKDNLYTNIFI